MTRKTHTGSSLYFVALIPEEEIEQELHQFKLDLYEKYQCKAALKSPAHITLIPPFSWANHQQDVLLKYFSAFTTDIHPLQVDINGFDRFRSQVFFANPVANDKLNQLQEDIYTYFQSLLKDKMQYKYAFHPHITLANRDLKAEHMDEIVQSFEQKKYIKSVLFKSISLLMHNGTKWETASQIYL